MSKRNEIIQHAYEIFKKNGYHQTSVIDISKVIDIKRSSLYHYFQSKEEIVYALIEQMYEKNPIIKTDGPTIDRLMDLCSQMLYRTINHIDIYKILFSALPALNETTKQKIEFWQKPFIEELNEILKDSLFDKQNRKTVEFLYLSLISSTMSKYVSNDITHHVEDDKKMIRSIIERVINR